MPTRIAATLALVVFAVCVVAGMTAENGFTTVLLRALLAMAGTLVVGLVIGAMAQRMLDENLASQKIAAAPEISEAEPPADGR